MPLSDEERAVLEFEARHPEVGPAKNQAVRTQLQLSPVRYYQLLSRLADSGDALQFDPVLVHRLRRIRERELRERSTRAAPRTHH
ncbi:MAG: DUF3263 domain-containing protein [Agromyces sp.]